MSNSVSDFNAVISITNPSPLTKEMQNNLPDDYDLSQSSGNFALLYGTGYELDNLKQTLLQVEANNYLYSPDTQQGSFQISGVGNYLIEFDIPFITPPLNVNISGADFTDVFIESTSRFGMVINVLTDVQDTLQYRASGFVGAASDEYIGDALYNNFGALYQFPRMGDSQIDDTYVSFYQNTDTFINVQSITPVFAQSGFDSTGTIPQFAPTVPPSNVPFITGIIRPTKIVTTPECNNELIDLSGNLIALLDTSSVDTTTSPTSSFYLTTGFNVSKIASNYDPRVYITGFTSTFEFNPWDQPSYVQEVFRADNKYRRILSALLITLSIKSKYSLAYSN